MTEQFHNLCPKSPSGIITQLESFEICSLAMATTIILLYRQDAETKRVVTRNKLESKHRVNVKEMKQEKEKNERKIKQNERKNKKLVLKE